MKLHRGWSLLLVIGAGCCSGELTVTRLTGPGDPKVRHGVPYQLSRTAFTLAEKPAAEGRIERTYVLTQVQQPDPNHRYTVRYDPPCLKEGSLDIQMGLKGEILSANAIGKEKITPMIKAVGEFTAMAIGAAAKLAAGAATRAAGSPLGPTVTAIESKAMVFDSRAGTPGSPKFRPATEAELKAWRDHLRPVIERARDEKELRATLFARDDVDRLWLETLLEYAKVDATEGAAYRSAYAEDLSASRKAAEGTAPDDRKKELSEILESVEKALDPSVNVDQAFTKVLGNLDAIKTNAAKRFPETPDSIEGRALGRLLASARDWAVVRSQSIVRRAERFKAAKTMYEAAARAVSKPRAEVTTFVEEVRKIVESDNPEQPRLDWLDRAFFRTMTRAGPLNDLLRASARELLEAAGDRVSLRRGGLAAGRIFKAALDLSESEWRHRYLLDLEDRIAAEERKLFLQPSLPPAPVPESKELTELRDRWALVLDVQKDMIRAKTLTAFLDKIAAAEANVSTTRQPSMESYETARAEIERILTSVRQKREALRPAEVTVEPALARELHPIVRSYPGTGASTPEWTQCMIELEFKSEHPEFVIVREKGYNP